MDALFKPAWTCKKQAQLALSTSKLVVRVSTKLERKEHITEYKCCSFKTFIFSMACNYGHGTCCLFINSEVVGMYEKLLAFESAMGLVIV